MEQEVSFIPIFLFKGNRFFLPSFEEDGIGFFIGGTFLEMPDIQSMIWRHTAMIHEEGKTLI